VTGRTRSARAAVSPSIREGSPTLMLVLATVGFLVNFWAWALMSPLGVAYREQLQLTAFQQALLVAVPVVVGSIGRIPVGALTDRLGARVMFPAVSFLTILPVLFVGLFGDSYPMLLLGGFFLGLGGTAFAVGVPLVNAWYPPARRGLALGIFGMGMGGTAVSASRRCSSPPVTAARSRSCWSRWFSRCTGSSRRCCCATPPVAP
jgi:MFS transporter, NNP family, nitrate/nitrite transporter